MRYSGDYSGIQSCCQRGSRGTFRLVVHTVVGCMCFAEIDGGLKGASSLLQFVDFKSLGGAAVSFMPPQVGSKSRPNHVWIAFFHLAPWRCWGSTESFGGRGVTKTGGFPWNCNESCELYCVRAWFHSWLEVKTITGCACVLQRKRANLRGDEGARRPRVNLLRRRVPHWDACPGLA